MALPVDVNTFKSTDLGAPVINGVAGSLAALLRACLQNGYNVQTPSSVVVANGVATATYASAHGYNLNRVILVASANTAAINGKKRVLSVTTYTLSFDATGVADGAVSGAITTKMAPLGFTEVFTGTNLAAFKSDDVTALSRSVLRVADTATTYARVISYESMTDVNTGIGPMPTEAQLSGGAYIVKSTTADATARPWVLVGDGRLFYLYTYPGGTSGRQNLFWWGESISFRGGDAYATVMGGFSSTANGTGNYDPGIVYCGSQTDAISDSSAITSFSIVTPVQVAQRGIDQLAQSVISLAVSGLCGLVGTGGALISGAPGYSLGFPSGVNGGFMLFPVMCRSSAAVMADLRGILPGVYQSPHDLTAFKMTEVSGVVSAPGRVFLIVPATAAYNNAVGCVALDMIGPWR